MADDKIKVEFEVKPTIAPDGVEADIYWTEIKEDGSRWYTGNTDANVAMKKVKDKKEKT